MTNARAPQLQVTSALTLVLLGQLKTCTILMGGVLFFDATPEPTAIMGACLAMVCIAMHTYLSSGSERHEKGCDAAPQAVGGVYPTPTLASTNTLAVNGDDFPEKSALLQQVSTR